jgi:hypothetical protein
MGGLVISGGRVVDPASGMDAVGDVTVLDGRIAAVGTSLGGAERVIDATGLVVAPGFIDLHAHGQSIPADRMQAFDGVTTSLDLEAGVMPVAAWYKRQAVQGRVLNYGGSAPTRIVRCRAVSTEGMSSSGKNSDSSVRARRYGSEAPIFATTRSYSGVHRSGMIPLTGLRVWRRVTAQRHGSNRGAETFTVPNKDKRRRDRLSLMGRGVPHRWHRRRQQQ